MIHSRPNKSSHRSTAAARATIAARRLAGSVVFGPGFVVAPPLRVPDAAELTAGLTAVAPDRLAAWLEGIALVRAGAARLADLRLLDTATGDGEATALRVSQLPAGLGGWVGDPLIGGADASGGVVSLTLAGPTFDPAEPIAALLVDEWVEVLPARRQDTSVVFHADTPGAQAPQAVLLAVAGDPGRPWDHDGLERVVLDTLQLARLRAVDPAVPGAPPVGHYLPALLFARNDEQATVATDFPRISP